MQYPAPPLHRERSSDAHRCVDRVITPNIGSDRAFSSYCIVAPWCSTRSRPPILYEVDHAKCECSYLGEFMELQHDPHIRMLIWKYDRSSISTEEVVQLRRDTPCHPSTWSKKWGVQEVFVRPWVVPTVRCTTALFVSKNNALRSYFCSRQELAPQSVRPRVQRERAGSRELRRPPSR